MSGIRIRHYKHRSVMVVIRDRARPFESPIACRLCGEHICKTYHFELDDAGTITVSSGVWAALQNMQDHYDQDSGEFYPAAGFEAVNEVVAPPAQKLIVDPLSLDAHAKAPRRERVNQ